MPALDVKFFGGQISVTQPGAGYRAGTDAILLAASLDAKPGDKILELGCGTGVVMLLAAHHLPDAKFTGLEKSQDMLALSHQNTADHDNIDIVSGSIRNIPHDWHLQYDQVVANPPYFDNRRAVRMSKDKEASFVNKGLTLDDWLGAMLVCLKPRGIGTLIYRADGLEKICAAFVGKNGANKAGRLRILPIQSYADEPAKRIIVQFRKGVKSESTLLPALVMHERGGTDRYAPEVTKILSGKTRLILS